MTSEKQDSPTPVRNVVFVCEHGAAKSILAGSYFNHLAELNGLDVRAVARGTDPGAEVFAQVQDDVQDAGLPLCTTTPTALTDGDVSAADLLVAFDVRPASATSVRQLSWNGLPLLSQDFVRGKESILAQVEALIDALKSSLNSGTNEK